MQPTPTTRLRLADGRSLDIWYDDAPETRGSVPLVYHPGTPASGLGFGPFTDAARRRGLRIVSWSRPGYGSSTRLPERRVAHVAADTAAVLDHLGEEGAYVVGHSGGGPHALACAALLPDRVLGTALIAGVAPWQADGLDFLEGMGAENHDEFGAALRGESDLAAYLAPAREGILGLTGPEVAAGFGDLVDEVDRAAITGDYAEFLADGMREPARVVRGLARRRPVVHGPMGLRPRVGHRPGPCLAGRARSDGAGRPRRVAGCPRPRRMRASPSRARAPEPRGGGLSGRRGRARRRHLTLPRQTVPD